MDVPDASSTPMNDQQPSPDALITLADIAPAGPAELALQHLDQLPTLSGVAVRILNLTSDEQFCAQEVIDLVGADPALASRVIRMCRCSPRGRASEVNTLERAVLLLGFDAIRSIVLSLQVFEMMERFAPQSGQGDAELFNRHAFWMHALASAIIAESLAMRGSLPERIVPSEAFLAGLLHDLGLLALHTVMPRETEQACAQYLADGTAFDHAARESLGIDSRTAGKRLAEHWSLPHCLGDVMWLAGQRLASLPQLPHRTTIALVSLADAVAARHHAVPVPGHSAGAPVSELAAELGITRDALDEVVAELPDALASRAEALGIDIKPDSRELLEAISRANETLGRTNHRLREQARQAHMQERMLGAIQRFHAEARPTESVVSVLRKVATSAAKELDSQFMTILFQPRPSRPWLAMRYAGDGRLITSREVDGPESMRQLQQSATGGQVCLGALGVLPWIESVVGEARSASELHMLPLPCGFGMHAVLIHDGVHDHEVHSGLEALAATWASAVAAAAQHEGARRLGEQLATANARLVQTRDELSSARALASIGEIAAGAAHEMNNPLTVISGRSQLLARRLGEAATEGRIDESSLEAAKQIVLQAHRLSNLISAMRMFAEPADAEHREVDITALVTSIVRKFRAECGNNIAIELMGDEVPIAHAWIDPDQVGQALAELIRNATEAEPKTVAVAVRTHCDGRLIIDVFDDGKGLPEHALAHAFDPFFSLKQAGRQPGVGLAQARRLLQANGGELTLDNRKEGGAIARISFSRWRAEDRRTIGAAPDQSRVA